MDQPIREFPDVGDKPMWERLPGEGDRAWAIFERYRSMSPKERSVDQAWRIQYGKGPGKEAPHYVREWVKQFFWKERARAWDAKVAADRHEAELEEHRKQAKQRVQAYQMLLGAILTIIQKANLKELDVAEARKLFPYVATGLETANKGMRTESGEPEKIELTIKREAERIARDLGMDPEDVIREAERLAAGKG